MNEFRYSEFEKVVSQLKFRRSKIEKVVSQLEDLRDLIYGLRD